MASSVIHMAVASEINKKLDRDISKLLIGTIAPDVAKLVGDTKVKSHFSNEETDNIPDIGRFLEKYEKHLNDDFVMGYYIHLYTDYLWFKYFIDDIDFSTLITRVDGTKVWCDKNTFVQYIYNDYTNINVCLIDKYNLDLKIFYSDMPEIPHIIEEIPMDRLDIIVNKTGNIITNSKMKKVYLFDASNVSKFIDTSVKFILSDIEKIL